MNSHTAITLILHNIRSIHNVGSIFRTADGAGVSRILLTGYTPSPVDRFGRVRKDLAKVALGAEKTIPWEQADELTSPITALKNEGYLILALEQHQESQDLFDFTPPTSATKLALIVGNEVEGLSPEELSLAEHILEIPMRGQKESLNVSVVAGIALFTLLNSKNE